MYERFYNLRERPFALSPDPDYLYLSRVHQEALGYLRYGIEGHAGFVVITGEIGSGKTTLLQTLLRSLDRNISVARIMNTMLDPRELLEAVMLDLGLEPAGLSKPAMIRELGRYLVEQRQAGRLVLLVIDEAQNLGLPTLEEVRMLSNLETEKSKLIQIVLVGQPNLRDTLGRPELEQMRQRITVSYHLQPLDARETGAYINHRLARASTGTPLVFPSDATRLIHAFSKGVPRMINVICDSVLLFGYGEEKAAIDVELVEMVVNELVSTGILPGTPARSASPVAPVPAIPTAASLPQPVPQVAAAANTVPSVDEGVAAAVRRDGLAEQQRVLAEEYRLLRELGRRAAPAAGRGPWPPPFGADPIRTSGGSTYAVPPFGTELPRSGWWTRVRRRLIGEPA
jgi:putative secretion ATPase (PEP-CTERM system associated)